MRLVSVAATASGTEPIWIRERTVPSLARPARRGYPHYVSYKKMPRAPHMFEGTFAALNIAATS
jgi:hypothetical protein